MQTDKRVYSASAERGGCGLELTLTSFTSFLRCLFSSGDSSLLRCMLLTFWDDSWAGAGSMLAWSADADSSSAIVASGCIRLDRLVPLALKHPCL